MCWIWGWSSYLFVGLPVSMSLKQNLNSSSAVLGSKEKRIGTLPAASSRHTKSGVQYSPKLTATTATQHGDARASQDPAQSATALTDLISSVLQQQSTPSKFAGAAGEATGTISSRPIAVPETRPSTIEGWTVREVAADGKAVLEGPNGIWKVMRGDTVRFYCALGQPLDSRAVLLRRNKTALGARRSRNSELHRSAADSIS